MTVRLISDWKRSHRLWSMRLLALFGAIAALEEIQPQLAAALPPHWYAWAMLIIGVARLVKQGNRDA